MKYQNSIIILIVSLFTLAASEGEMTMLEKDKYLACNAIVINKMEKEKEAIDKLFEGKDNFLAKGLRRVLTIEMILQCKKDITEEKTHEIYKDLIAVTQNFDYKPYDFEYDYSPYKEKHEFIFEPHLSAAMKDLRNIVAEHRKALAEKNAKEKADAEGAKKDDTGKKEDKPQGDL